MNRHEKYPNQWPTIKNVGGGEMKVCERDLIELEDHIAKGRSITIAGIALGFDERDFRAACKVNAKLLEAIARGKARDRQEYMDDLRAVHKAGKHPIISIWYGKQQYGMTDKASVAHSGQATVVVNTGVPASIKEIEHAPVDADAMPNVIEHDDA